jgi:hypothetical protein
VAKGITMAKKSLTERMLAHTQTIEEPKYQMYEEFVPTEMKVTKSILPPFEPEKKYLFNI